jgi:CheY-like chemotaxis protein
MAMKSVLLVDDDNTALLGTGVRLKSMRHIVYTANDAVSAIAAVRKNESDVAVLDISLPAGDGFLVADRLQNLVGSAATPIIFIAASENRALRERAMKLRSKWPCLPETTGGHRSRHNGHRTARQYSLINSTGRADYLIEVSTGTCGRSRADTLCKPKRNSASCWSTMTAQWFVF